MAKPEDSETTKDANDEYGGGPDPLYVADFKQLGPAKRWKKNTLVNQKFILTLDQKRGPKDGKDIHVGAIHAIAVATDK